MFRRFLQPRATSSLTESECYERIFENRLPKITKCEKPMTVKSKSLALSTDEQGPRHSRASLLDEIAEQKKQQFLRLVEHLARLRDVQYGCDAAKSIVAHAKQILAQNLPSNLLRAASIVVDGRHGFPPDWSSFHQPEWVNARQLLPEGERGSLVCSNFKDIAYLDVGDSVVLTQDIPSKGLFAGMAGIVRDVLSTNEEEGTPELLSVEFGEPEESLTNEIEVPIGFLRTPRPGDLLEHFRS